MIEGRASITEADIEFIRPGETTREEILLCFGEPDHVSGDGSKIAYRWVVVQGYLMTYGAGGPWGKEYTCGIEFHEDGRVKRFQRSAPFFGLDFGPSAGSKSPTIDPLPDAPAAPGSCWTGQVQKRFSLANFSWPGREPSMLDFLGDSEEWNVSTRVRSSAPMDRLLAVCLIHQIEAAGHRHDPPEAPIRLSGQIVECALTSKIGTWCWEVVAGVEIELTVSPDRGHSIVRRYRSKRCVLSPFSLPDDRTYQRAMQGCLADIQSQIAQDSGLAVAFGF